MDTVFAWKKIDEEIFETETIFMYGNSASSNDLSGWNSIHEDLDIIITVSQKNDLEDLHLYFVEGETAGIILRWVGDNKFGGCSLVENYDFENPVTLKCRIPHGSCATSFKADCNLIIKSPGRSGKGDWFRPPGSIIAEIPIVENITIGQGNWFPVGEYDGDGKSLISWEFVNIDDLNIALSSGVLVLIDRKHPFAAIGSGNDKESLMMLMIIQAFTRKAFSDTIFDQLVEKNENNVQWETGSLGASLSFILKKICVQLNVNSFQILKKIYLDRPEKIDESVDKIFSRGLILNTEHDTASV